MVGIARGWLARSAVLRAAAERGFPVLTYEGFCADPPAIFRAFGLDAELEGISATHEVRVKDYAPQTIRNMNARQIDRLTPTEVAAIGEVLARDRQELDFWGYRILG